MNITGHNSYSDCRFCDIKGIYSEKYKHIYFPTDLKKTYTKKNNSTWLTCINEIKITVIIKEKKAFYLNCNQSNFPNSFPSILCIYFLKMLHHICLNCGVINSLKIIQIYFLSSY